MDQMGWLCNVAYFSLRLALVVEVIGGRRWRWKGGGLEDCEDLQYPQKVFLF
jgi:hypothetical protein